VIAKEEKSISVSALDDISYTGYLINKALGEETR